MDNLGDRRLARLIRRSPILDRHLKEYWLRVLPHLDRAERARLWSILQAGNPALDDRAGE